MAVSLLGIVIIILLSLQTPILNSVRASAWNAWIATIGSWLRIGTLEISNDVSDQIASLTSENRRLKAELNDYRRLRRQIGSPGVEDYRTISATVAGRPLESLRAEYVINRGANDGVIMNAPVVVQGSVLIGFVRELHGNSSLVRLLIHPDTRIGAEATGENPGRALLQGKYYTSAYLVNIPRDINLQDGQDVVSIAESANIPYGLIIGMVDEIFGAEHDPYQEARLKLPYDPDSIVAVTILTPP